MLLTGFSFSFWEVWSAGSWTYSLLLLLRPGMMYTPTQPPSMGSPVYIMERNDALERTRKAEKQLGSRQEGGGLRG